MTVVYVSWLCPLILVWIILIEDCSCQRVLLTVTKEGKCISNVSSAIAPIYDRKDIYWGNSGQFNTYVKYVAYNPKKLCSRNSCHYDGRRWTTKSSLEPSPVNNLILDRRWEGFPIHITKHVEDTSRKLQYVNVGIINTEDFVIPFSVQIENEAHIFLCEANTYDVPSSRCYWFLLQAWEGKNSAFRKCNAHEIQNYYNGKAPKGYCEESTEVYKHSKLPKFLSEVGWTHLKISKKGSKITLSNQEDEALINADIEEFQILPRLVYFHSKLVNGLWKLHYFNYFYSETDGETMLYLNVKVGLQCLSMFVAMCQQCSMEMEFLTYNWLNKENRLDYRKLFYDNSVKWREVTFCLTVDKNDLYLRINTKSTYKRYIKTFWALSDIRTIMSGDTSNAELRIVEAEGAKWTGKCQFMESGDILDVNIQSSDTLGSWNKCNDFEFGEECLPCTNIFSSKSCPKQSKYCQLVEYSPGNFSNKCYCSIGYQGPSCQATCDSRHYGHSCMKGCQNCQDGCKNDTRSGKCDPPGLCFDNYQGEKCDQPPGLFLFDSPPEINVSYTSCDLYLSSFTGQGDASAMRYYKFQYREVGNKNDWQDIHRIPLTFNVTEKVTIRNLKVQTNYEVRVFGYGTNSDLRQLEHVIPTTYNFTTYCDDINYDSLNISVDKTSVTIYSTKTLSTPCQFNDYYICINNTKKEELKNSRVNYTIDKLQPSSYYELEIVKNKVMKWVKLFKTKDSEPDAVRSFKFSKVRKNPSSLNLIWEEPKKTYGDLLFYTISAELKWLDACQRPPNPPNTVTIFNVSPDKQIVTIPVKPYAKYTIDIKANNSAGYGPSSQIEVNTDPLDEIKDDEIPRLTATNPERNYATLEFEFNCENMLGPLDTDMTITGTNPWCTSTNYYRDSLSAKIKIENLKPFCNYDVKMLFVRQQYYSSKEVVTSFKTKESVPNKIETFLITSKGPDHVSIRWPPPFPPTGQLEVYQAEIRTNPNYWNAKFRNVADLNFLPAPCKLWPEFHCVTIHSIIKGYVHEVKISSKNKGYEQYSEAVSVKFQAQEDPPDKPYGLNVSWTDENFLNLEWFHPLQTNGVLTGFKILMNDNEVFAYKITSENDYLAIYRITVKKGLDLPRNYNIAVKACNLKGDSVKEEVYNSVSPPPIPEDDIEEIDKSENAIIIKLRRIEYKQYFARFLYILISECDSCQESLINFSKDVEAYHKTSEEVKAITAPHFWKVFTTYTYEHIQTVITIGKPNYIIKKDASYTMGFIWVSKYGGYVRSNYAIRYIKHHDNSEERPTFHAGKIVVIVIALIIVIVAALFAVRRYINKTAIKNMFADDIPIADISERTYVNKIELTGQRTRIHSIRPMSVIATKEICPGVPLFKTVNSKRIKLEHFEDYVRDAIESGELERQHRKFPRGQTKAWTYGAHPENKTKNRYQNLIAYDHTRVVLQKINDDKFSDYVNANFIDGYRHPKAYIATQGPKKNTVSDFWRMIWQEKVTHIVMMANVIEGNKKKTEQYWPNINEEQTFGDFRVSFVSSEIHANYEYRKFELQYNYAKPRQVGQLHFKVWPDHGVPLYPQSLVPFLQKMLTLRSRDFPLVVHCSAGVGRTGTVILCDICLRMAAAEGYVDVFSMLEHLRSQRPNMVDNVEQYKLAHLVILNCLTGMNTSIPVDENFTKAMGEIDNIESQLSYIRNCEWQDDAMKTVAFAESDLPPIVPAKNRFPEITPDPAARVLLHPYPPASPAPSSTYINAVQVDGFCQPGRFIVTQFPLPGTVSDFWRLVSEKKISVIVCLNELPLKDPKCKRFWPEKTNEFRPIEEITIRHIKNKHLQVLSIMTFELSSSYEYQENQTRTVEIVKFHGWKYPDPVPDYSDFITFVEDVATISRGSQQMLVTCFDGATASGLFIAMTFLTEKIKLEQECDVCQAVRSIRTSRKQFTNSKEQLEFLYKASILYVEEQFLQYSNMNLQAK